VMASETVFSLLFLFLKEIKGGLWYHLAVCMYPAFVVRQRLGKHLPGATNIHATIELLDTVFSVYQKEERAKPANLLTKWSSSPPHNDVSLTFPRTFHFHLLIVFKGK
jgi:hypothetical protein